MDHGRTRRIEAAGKTHRIRMGGQIPHLVRIGQRGTGAMAHSKNAILAGDHGCVQ